MGITWLSFTPWVTPPDAWGELGACKPTKRKYIIYIYILNLWPEGNQNHWFPNLGLIRLYALVWSFFCHGVGRHHGYLKPRL